MWGGKISQWPARKVTELGSGVVGHTPKIFLSESFDMERWYQVMDEPDFEPRKMPAYDAVPSKEVEEWAPARETPTHTTHTHHAHTGNRELTSDLCNLVRNKALALLARMQSLVCAVWSKPPFFLSGDKGTAKSAVFWGRIQFRGAVSTDSVWIFSSGFSPSSPGFLCNLVRRMPQNVEKIARFPGREKSVP